MLNAVPIEKLKIYKVNESRKLVEKEKWLKKF